MKHSQALSPALVNGEMEVWVDTYIATRTSPTTALMYVEIGSNKTVITKIHNVPEVTLDLAEKNGRIRRPVTIGMFDEGHGSALILKRVRFDRTEYHLSS